MESIQLDKYGQNTTIHAQAEEDGANGFDKQPEYGRNYDPSDDKRDMYRLGRKQELKRRFKYFSIAGYVVVLGNTWEFAVVTSTFGLSNGGTAGALWMTIIVICGMMLNVLSLAEVASMAPTSGGQYHWVSEIAPAHIQKQLSYAVGWMTMVGWQVAVPANAYIFAQQILALICICDPGYTIQGWQASLLTIASAASAITISVFVMQKLTLAEGMAVVAHCFGFVAFLAVLWVMGPKADASETFFNFQDANGWGSYGTATLVGIVGPVASFIGGDSAVHLAEELQDAKYVLPRAMITGCVMNYAMGLVGLITFLFNVGTIDDSLYRYGGQPWVAVVYRITGSRAATIVLILVIAVNFFCLQMNCVMTSSRQLWSFARDKGIPCHGFFARVTSDGLPRNAVLFTFTFAALLSLIIIGSSTAFNVFLSFGNAGIMSSYLIVIATLLHRRFTKGIGSLPATKFSLGWAGLPINLVALGYLFIAVVFVFFPANPNPAPVEMNWASLMFGSVLIIAFVWYLVKAKNEYDGPVEYVRKDV